MRKLRLEEVGTCPRLTVRAEPEFKPRLVQLQRLRGREEREAPRARGKEFCRSSERPLRKGCGVVGGSAVTAWLLCPSGNRDPF